jgi:hypothetical protein
MFLVFIERSATSSFLPPSRKPIGLFLIGPSAPPCRGDFPCCAAVLIEESPSVALTLKTLISNPKPTSAQSARGNEMAPGRPRPFWYYIC